MKMITRMVDGENLNAMVKALKNAGLSVDRDNSAGTVIVTNSKNVELFRALKKDGNVWLIRMAENLLV